MARSREAILEEVDTMISVAETEGDIAFSAGLNRLRRDIVSLLENQRTSTTKQDCGWCDHQGKEHMCRECAWYSDGSKSQFQSLFKGTLRTRT